MIKTLQLMLALVVATVTVACSSNNEPPEPQLAHRTVLVYMAASNNLGYEGRDSADIHEMQAAARAGDLQGGHLLIYHASPNRPSSLSEIDSKGNITLLKTYTDGLTSVHSQRMADVIADARTFAPAHQLGLVLWSHGDGWLEDGITETPAGTDGSETATDGGVKRAFGVEKGRKMNITTLANVLQDNGPIDFVYFDCCFMGSVETVYQLRHATDRIVASAIELPADGMPYDRNVRPLLNPAGADLEQAARNTFNLYNSKTGMDRTCGMAVYDLTKADALAQATADIYRRARRSSPAGYTPQFMQVASPFYFYDLYDYVQAIDKDNATAADHDPSLFTRWQAAFNDFVPYAENTPYLWNHLSLARMHGLSTYILYRNEDANVKNYDQLDWYRDVARFIQPDKLPNALPRLAH